MTRFDKCYNIIAGMRRIGSLLDDCWLVQDGISGTSAGASFQILADDGTGTVNMGGKTLTLMGSQPVRRVSTSGGTSHPITGTPFVSATKASDILARDFAAR